MKRISTILLLALLVIACGQKDHPISVYVNPTFTDVSTAPDQAIVKIAVLPFVSAIHHADDPDGDAPRTLEKFFVPALDARADYSFVSPNTVLSAVEMQGWEEDYDKFLKDYPTSDKPDIDLLGRLATTLGCDAFLVPVVDLWQKDEADYQEDSTPATYVGATITIIDAKNEPGAILFRAVDEDYLEGVRTETGSRSVVSGGGSVRSDLGSKVHDAPPYEDVAVKVAEALVGSLPVR